MNTVNKKSDEKYPLLYLIVDKEDGTSATSRNNKKFFDRRSIGITSGYLSTCWFSSLIFLLATISMFILLMTALNSYKFHRIPRCIIGDNPMLDNSTIHLVHGPDYWTQNQLDMVEKILQIFPNHRVHLILIKKIKYFNNINNNKINNNNNDDEDFKDGTTKKEIITTTTTTTLSNNRKLLRILDDPSLIGAADKTNNKDEFAGDFTNDSLFGWPFFDPRDFINTFLKKSIRSPIRNRITTQRPVKIKNIAALLLRYPTIFVEILSYEQIFDKTPLFLTWQNLNEDTKNFAIRVIQLWQYGGLSFDLKQTKNSSTINSKTSSSSEDLMVSTESYKCLENSTMKKFKESDQIEQNAYVDSLLYLGYSNFQMIPGGIVTLAENGCHMETKSACHSFFGEILLNLKYSNRLTTPEDVIKAALKYFLKPPHRNFRRT